MKSKGKVAGVAVSILFLLIAAVGFRSTVGTKLVKAAAMKDVVTLGCDTYGLEVIEVFQSAGAPAATSTDCAQALSDFSTKGFSIDFVTGGSNTLTYTLDSPTSVWPWYKSAPLDVVILFCDTPTYGGDLRSPDTSAGAPFIQSYDCTHDLADLLNAGFTTAFATSAGGKMGDSDLTYTLTRPLHSASQSGIDPRYRNAK